MVSDQHSISTRHSVQSLVLPRVRSSGAKTFLYSAGKMWNALPTHLRTSNNFLSFKFGLRKHLRMEMQRKEDSDCVV